MQLNTFYLISCVVVKGKIPPLGCAFGLLQWNLICFHMFPHFMQCTYDYRLNVAHYRIKCTQQRFKFCTRKRFKFWRVLSVWHSAKPPLPPASPDYCTTVTFTLCCRGRPGTRQSFAECPRNGTRQTLFRCRFKRRVLFAECILAFAECFRHSAKEHSPAVACGNINLAS